VTLLWDDPMRKLLRRAFDRVAQAHPRADFAPLPSEMPRSRCGVRLGRTLAMASPTRAAWPDVDLNGLVATR